MIKNLNIKKQLLTLFAITTFSISYGQVGINNTSPKATLDVTAKNTNGSTPEGLIAPRLTGDQLQLGNAQYATDQIGTMVYVTSPVTVPDIATQNITSAGYYYFDGSVWKSMGGTSTASSFVVTPLITASYTVQPTDDFIRLNITNASQTLTLPTSGILPGKMIYVSNIGTMDIPTIPQVINLSYNPVTAGASGILIYLGSGEWDWLTGF